MKTTFAKAAVIGLLLTLAYNVSITQAGVGWPMRGYDVRNTNASPHYGMKRGRLAWRFETGSLVDYARPAVGADGTIYVVFNNRRGSSEQYFGELRALRRDGSLIWATKLTDSKGRGLMCFTTPIVAPNGNLYVGWGRFEGFDFISLAMLALDSSGKLLWRYEPNIPDQTAWDNEPLLGPDGTIYASLNTFFSNDQHCSIVAINSADGSLKWRWVSPVQDVFADTPVLAPGGRLILKSSSFWDDATLYSLDASAGKLIWAETFAIGGSGKAPSVDAQGNIYAPNVPQRDWLTKFDADGNVQWEHETNGGSISASPPLFEGKVYVSSGEGLQILDAATGERLETLLPDVDVFSTIVDRAGNIYMLTTDFGLQAYSAAGELMWGGKTGVSSRMAIINGGDGRILATARGWLHAFESLYPYGDMNCDGSLDLSDVEHFIGALIDAEQYENEHPDCDLNLADLNSDGSVDLRDVEPFIAALLG